MTKKKKELIKSLSQHKNDVGSTEVQIGILNEKIIKENKKNDKEKKRYN